MARHAGGDGAAAAQHACSTQARRAHRLRALAPQHLAPEVALRARRYARAAMTSNTPETRDGRCLPPHL